jgi:hypothetical protein
MGMRWKNSIGHLLVLCILYFACAGVLIHRARQFARLAPVERTATTKDVYSRYILFRYLRFNYYICNYTFLIDGEPHNGSGDCPQAGGVRAGSSATVYFDPNDPSVNSLIEFSAASGREYGYAATWVLFGAFFILIMVFAATLAAIKKRGRGRVVVDWHGTVIDPEEIGPGAMSGGLPGDGRMAGVSSSEGPDSSAPSGLRRLYLETVNQIHPDRALDENDRALRERLMKRANAAFEQGDAKILQEVLEEYRNAAPPV